MHDDPAVPEHLSEYYKDLMQVNFEKNVEVASLNKQSTF